MAVYCKTKDGPARISSGNEFQSSGSTGIPTKKMPELDKEDDHDPEL